jgi:Gas vesicle protein
MTRIPQPSRPRHTTVPVSLPPRSRKRPAPPRRAPVPRVPPRVHVARIIPPEASLLDVVDSLLNKGVVLNADVVLALANVDLIYLRLSALLCAADRVLPPSRR